MDAPRSARVGGYQLELPDFWQEISVREKPPLFASNSIVGDGVSFDFTVLEGLGENDQERQRFTSAMLDAYADSKAQEIETEYHGMTFRGHRFEDAVVLGPKAIHEYYLTTAYGDLIHFAYSIVAPSPQEEALKNLFFTMVEGAIVMRGYELAKSGKLP